MGARKARKTFFWGSAWARRADARHARSLLAGDLGAVARLRDRRYELVRRYAVVVEVHFCFAIGQIDHRRVDAAHTFERFLHLGLAVAAGHAGDAQFDVRHGSSPSTII